MTINQSGNENITITGDEKNDTNDCENIDKTKFLDLWRGDTMTIIQGGNGNITINGDGKSDTIYAGTGNDTINGGSGNDAIYGSSGNDVIYANTGNDTINGGSGRETIHGSTNAIDLIYCGSGSEAVYAGSGNETIFGGSGNDTISCVPATASCCCNNSSQYLIYGGSASDIIYGGMGNDTIVAGTGAVTMAGGAGNDSYYINSSLDTVVENANAGTDTVFSSISYSLVSNVENLTLTGTAALTGTGNNLNNIITANTGNDTLIAGSGIDTLTGGSGNDTFVINNASDIVIEKSTAGIETINSSVSYTVSSNVENLTLTGTSNINATANNMGNILTGNSGKNSLIGGTGNDTLIAGSGADVMAGGAGNNTYIINSNSDIIIENTNVGTDTVISTASYTLASNLENLTLSGAAALIAAGNNLNNIITGNTGNDTLISGTGNDTMIGGSGNDNYILGTGNNIINDTSGNDTYIYNSGSDTINDAGGSDTLKFGTNIKSTNAVFVSDASKNLDITFKNVTGQVTVQNWFTNSANQIESLVFGGDNVTLTNTTINQQFAAPSTTESSSVSCTLVSNATNLILTGTASIIGAGNTLNDSITGNTGNDTLIAGSGLATMAGGAGNDTYIINSASDVIIENANAGNDTVISSVSYTLASNVENLILTGSTSLIGAGNSLNDSITGNTGNDTLIAATGTATMAGGAGNDTYIINSASDVIIENANAGNDTVISSVSYTLASNVENLILTGSTSLIGAGNNLNDSISGNAYGDTLIAGSAADTMAGGAGDDIYEINSASDVIIENANAGNDTVISSASYTLASNIENLTLSGAAALIAAGNNLNDSISGNTGNDTLISGTGNDTMAGGSGNDTYILGTGSNIINDTSGNDTYIYNSGSDTINDAGGTDTLKFGSNIKSTNAIFVSDASKNLDITFSNVTGQVTVQNWFTNSANQIESLVFGGDNVTLTNTTINQQFAAPSTTESSSVSCTLVSNAMNLILTGTASIIGAGNSLNDSITGNTGDDTLIAGSGLATMAGGAGNDTYIINSASDVIIENPNAGNDTVISSVSYTLASNVENLILTGSTSLIGAGNNLNDSISGNAYGDTLIAGSVADTMAGGAGNDVYEINSASDVIIENPNAGNDTVISSVSYTLASNVENLILTGSTSLIGAGNNLNDSISGNAYGDTLIAGSVADTMAGGAGNDVYEINSASDVIIENANAGNDTVISSVSYTLGANVENLTLTGAGHIGSENNGGGDVLTANSGDTLISGSGTDTLVGLSGTDTFYINNSSDSISGVSSDTVISSVNYTLGSNINNLTISAAGHIGSENNGGGDVLTANSGDTLISGSGTDTLVGLSGTDTFYINNSSDSISGVSSDTVISSVNYTLGSNINNLTISAAGHIGSENNGGGDVLTANSGDTLISGTGTDTLVGLSGTDTFYINNSSDSISGVSSDTVISSVNYTLGSNINNLTISAAGHIGSENNGGGDVLTANSGDTLISGTGTDTLVGLSGTDTFYINNSSDSISGVASDTIISSVNFTLGSNINNLTISAAGHIGSENNGGGDVLTANSGDTLISGTGTDTLVGLSGTDTFYINNTNDNISGVASDTVISSVSYTLASNIENLILTGSTSLIGAGNNINDSISGNAYGDTLIAGTVADTMAGGLGNDTYEINSASDVIIENSNAGTDTVISTVSYTLASNIENLILTGSTSLIGAGNNINDSISGNAYGDTLIDGSVADTMAGGAGNDVYEINNTNDVIIENPNAGTDTVISSVSYTLASNIENLTLTGTSALTGTANNLNDTLVAGSGADTLNGGTGNDTFVIDSNSDVVNAVSGTGINTVDSSVSYTMASNIENLTLTDHTQTSITTTLSDSGNPTLNGSTATVYGDPFDWTNLVDWSQGANSYNYPDDCAIVSVVNILARTGKLVSENDVISNMIAPSSTVTVGNIGTNGIITLDQTVATLGLYGISATEYGIGNNISAGDINPGESNSKGTIGFSGLAQAVQNNQGIILGVDAGQLWGSSYSSFDGQAHAVIVTGDAYDSNNNLEGFYVCDSGLGLASDADEFVDLNKLTTAWLNVGDFALITNNSIVKDASNGFDNSLNNVITAVNDPNYVNYLQSNSGNDTLVGGAGDDEMYGTTGNKTFVAGTGNDYIVGKTDNNTYKFTIGDGSDRVFDLGVNDLFQIDLKSTALTNSSVVTVSGNDMLINYNSSQIDIRENLTRTGTQTIEFDNIGTADINKIINDMSNAFGSNTTPSGWASHYVNYTENTNQIILNFTHN